MSTAPEAPPSERCEHRGTNLPVAVCVSEETASEPCDTAPLENFYPNHVHHINDVHPDPASDTPEQASEPAGDPLEQASDPLADDLATAIATVEDAIAEATDNPGALATKDFQEAVKFIREESQEDWFCLRGPIKKSARDAGIKLGDIDKQTRPDSEAGAQDESSSTDELVELIRDLATLFHAPDGTCYASLNGEGPARTYRLDTKAFMQWASFAFYTATATEKRPGRAVSETTLRTATTVLSGIATHEGDERPVFLRVARREGIYYIDLGAEDWSAVEITPGGWRIVARPPIHFWRPNTLRPLPIPVAGGDLSLLWRCANVDERDRPLVLAWMLEALRPETPFVVLELIGQQGTAKSSTQSKLRRCIDPNAADLRAAPKSTEDLSVSAGVNWVASLNNLSHLSPAMQDALCTLATGGAFAGRTLFTNADETLIEAKRPVVLNGIVPVVTAQDLADRVVHISLPELTAYRTEAEIDEEFERDAPSILGGLLDLFAKTLARLPDIRIERPPRMSDFAKLGEAMMRATGKDEGSFLTLYLTNRRDSVARGLEASPVASAVSRLADESPSAMVWQGTMGALLSRLGAYRDGTEAWPRAPRGLGDALRRQSPALAQVGIDVTIGPAGRTGVPVTIKREPEREHREHCERGLDRNSQTALSDMAMGEDRV
jgi:hypothetical protein